MAATNVEYVHRYMAGVYILPGNCKLQQGFNLVDLLENAFHLCMQIQISRNCACMSIHILLTQVQKRQTNRNYLR